MKILINYPSRSRPHLFMSTIKNHIEKLSGKHDVIFLIKIDQEDISMNNQRILKYIDSLNSDKVKLFVHVLPDCKGKIDSINRYVSDYDWDLLFCTADDMTILEQNYDDIIANEISVNDSICLNYNCDDRLNDFKSLIIFPIITRKLYDKFGYLYNPEYISEWCDNEMTEVYSQLGYLKHIDKRIIHHKWRERNDDTLMSRNIERGLRDKDVFAKRKITNFGLPMQST